MRRAQPIDPAQNSTSPAAQLRGSKRRNATSAATTATTTLYDVITHETPTIVVSKAP